MNRRGFAFGAFFASVSATIGKALGYDGTAPAPPPPPQLPQSNFKQLSGYTIKVGRKVMRLKDDKWEVFADTEETARRSNEAADVKEKADQKMYEFYQEHAPLDTFTPPLPRERLSLPPEDAKHWSDAMVEPMPLEPFDTHNAARDQDIDELIRAFKDPDSPIARVMIADRENLSKLPTPPWCSGHNGPALGLTAHNPMTDMGDGRRLCPYCYNKEIADGRAGGTDEGRPAS